MNEDSAVLLTHSVSLRPELASASTARRLLRDALARTDRQEWSDAAELAIGEVVANAVLHAHTAIEVSLEVRVKCVRVEVRDFNPSMPIPREADVQATTGRGMALVAALSSQCGVRSVFPDGKVVWFEVGAEGGSEAAEADLLAAWGAADDWADTPLGEGEPVEIWLLALPVTLWAAAAQHQDAMLRELVLYQAEHHDAHVDLTLADQARGFVGSALGSQLSELPPFEGGHSLLPMVQQTTGSGIPAVDVAVKLPQDIAPAFSALCEALGLAETLSIGGRLLVRPGLPEIVAVREWVCAEVAAQVAGRAPRAWRGTAQAQFETVTRDSAVPAPPEWDAVMVTESDRGVVAADDANRIVAISRSLAATLGWEVEDLVGRRVVTVIPPELREAHVAGFSRHLNTGQAHALGVPLELPVLRRDDTRVMCSFMVEQAPASQGRSVYLAWIEPMA